MRPALVLALLACGLANAAPQRFAPEQPQRDGRVTLTPAFSPDGNTIYFAQSECTPIWECPQRLKRSRRTADGWSTPERVPLPAEGRVDYPSVTPA
jgi:sugar lactone lactonase YvrE